MLVLSAVSCSCALHGSPVYLVRCCVTHNEALCWRMQPEGPAALNEAIIECAWDKDTQRWRFMRVREDKNTPNAMHVYHKVWGRIGSLTYSTGPASKTLNYCFGQATH